MRFSVGNPRALLFYRVADDLLIALIPLLRVTSGNRTKTNRFGLAVFFRGAKVSVRLRICSPKHGIFMVMQIGYGSLIQQRGSKLTFIAQDKLGNKCIQLPDSYDLACAER